MSLTSSTSQDVGTSGQLSELSNFYHSDHHSNNPNSNTVQMQSLRTSGNDLLQQLRASLVLGRDTAHQVVLIVIMSVHVHSPQSLLKNSAFTALHYTQVKSGWPQLMIRLSQSSRFTRLPEFAVGATHNCFSAYRMGASRAACTWLKLIETVERFALSFGTEIRITMD